LKSEANEEFITSIRGSNGTIKVELYPRASVDPNKIVDFINNYNGRIKFVNGSNPGFEIQYKVCGLPERDEEELLKAAEDFVRDMRYILDK